MAIFKCKMCGGSLNVNDNESYTTCEYCGTKQTLPKLDNDERANLYDRANHFRRNNEYDKAGAIYEKILNQDSTDSEAYWSLVLCRYGIEYVEDPQTHKRIPTVNRAQFTSIYADENYKQAIEHANEYQKELYEIEAKHIDEIQKNILSISQKEGPFDIFICYKETDNQGLRTVDSVLANDLYHQLTQEGFKVFYSRITLEDKLGSAYEPYIFAALNSAKIMVVLGTKPEYFKAVWVKNEWSRYLGLIKSGSKKMLIPAYKGMDPYDLPEEFSHLQAQDMSKLGFMQDLIRGIKKIIEADKPKEKIKETVVIGSSNANIIPLLKRTKLFLEDSNWREVNSYTERVLDIEPENATAYLYKMMAELKITHLEKLEDLQEPFEDNSNYQKVLRFGEDELINTLKGYINSINGRKEQGRLQTIYQNGLNYMDKGDLSNAIIIFDKIPNFKDSIELRTKCIEKQEENRKDKIYYSAFKEFQLSKIPNLENAIKQFESISGWKDSDQKIQESKKKIEEIKAKEEADKLEKARIAEERRIAAIARKQKIKKIAVIAIPSVIMIITFLILLFNVFIPNSKYNQALELINEGKYAEAKAILTDLEGFSDSENQITIVDAYLAFESQSYEEAITLLEGIGIPVDVSYDLDGGLSTTISMGDDTPYKDGYTFNGWELIDYSINNAKGDYNAEVELKATYLLSQYTIIFELNGGTGVSDLSYNINSSTILLPNPTRVGYTFSGWYDNPDFNEESITEIVSGSSGDITLYALWTINEYTISFNSNGGSSVSNITQNFNTIVPEPTEPTKLDYVFGGWYKNATLTETFVFNTMPAEDVTLYAKWIYKYYTITYDPDGGNLSALSQQVEYDKTYNLSLPTRENYVFLGWYSNNVLFENGTWTRTSDISLVARWDSIYEYSVSDNEVTITGFNYAVEGTTIVFPEEIFGYPVVQIGEVPTSIYSYSSKPIGIPSNIISIVVPNSVQTIGRGAFNGASSLQSITIPFVGESRSGENGYFNLGYIFGSEEFNNSYEAGTWDGDLYQAGYYYLPNSLTSIIITDTTILGAYAFQKIRNITSLVLPNNLVSIGYMAFYSNNISGSIIIPLSVTSISNYAFDVSSTIANFTIYVRATSKPSGWNDGWVDWEERVVWGYTGN